MKKSIIQPDLDRCIVCGQRSDIHTHEVFFGTANRAKSIKHGMVVALCAKHHNMSAEGVHFNKPLDNFLKKLGQHKFEQVYGHEKFMEVFGRNYI